MEYKIEESIDITFDAIENIVEIRELGGHMYSPQTGNWSQIHYPLTK